MTDRQTQTTDEPRILMKTKKLLQRASELDPEAWESPTKARMQARRNRSYKAAVQEMMDRD